MKSITRKPIDAPAWTLGRGLPQAGRYASSRLSEDELHDGSLILVNKAHPVATCTLRLEDVTNGMLQAAGREEPRIRLDAECLAQLSALLDACEGGDRIAVVSGYRSKQTQRDIYADKLRERGRAYTESYVALPGASEHQTGLAVDVGLAGRGLDYIAPSFPEDEGPSAAFRRLAPEYGFVQRYQESKTEITGIACEPWHYRYVGRPHAAIMTRENLCLEEYTSYLKQYAFGKAHLLFTDGVRTYEIYYVAALPGGTDVPVPGAGESAGWELSGNNRDGYVVAAVYDKEPIRHVR
ncbi:D-alanyl-D-alanine carboxypeptidase family protein [Paenibacillus glycinis]|uniref:D-alanyl-D-alanine carboxypeptidase family protein n=1 Tax=Paenibacillus glycinis TaxID=2697035 RepID=A0ABW9XYZ1_9BACL|nr:D-alanyl-D-alanine carboxypeptidase family protein [Paenibacillus glycinis]NBD27954.1 D-alanyl-D-alanine carboxypeptidase family protein [Paenibacillus glycinis]